MRPSGGSGGAGGGGGGGALVNQTAIIDQLRYVIGFMDTGDAKTAWQILNTAPDGVIPIDVAEVVRLVIAGTYPDVDFISRLEGKNLKVTSDFFSIKKAKMLFKELCTRVLREHSNDARCTRLARFTDEDSDVVEDDVGIPDTAATGGTVFGGTTFCIIGMAFIKILNSKRAGIEWIKHSKRLGSSFAFGAFYLTHYKISIQPTSPISAYVGVREIMLNSDRTLLDERTLGGIRGLAFDYIGFYLRKECWQRALQLAYALRGSIKPDDVLCLLGRCYYYGFNTPETKFQAYKYLEQSYKLGNVHAAARCCSIQLDANDKFLVRDTAGNFVVSPVVLEQMGLPQPLDEYIRRWTYSAAGVDRSSPEMSAVFDFRNYLVARRDFADIDLEDEMRDANVRSGSIEAMVDFLLRAQRTADLVFWLDKIAAALNCNYLDIARRIYQMAMQVNIDYYYTRVIDILSQYSADLSMKELGGILGPEVYSNTAFIRELERCRMIPLDGTEDEMAAAAAVADTDAVFDEMETCEEVDSDEDASDGDDDITKMLEDAFIK